MSSKLNSVFPRFWPSLLRSLLLTLLTAILSTTAWWPSQSSHATLLANAIAATPPLRASVILELLDAPVAELYAQASAQGDKSVTAAQVATITQLQLAQIEQTQQALLTTLSTLEVPVLYRTQRVYNGIAVRATPDQLVQLARLPGVKAIHPLLAKRPLLDKSVAEIGAPLLWQGGSNLAVHGEGISIAIIDTGLDYLHADFGGPGNGYANNNPQIIGDVPGFPSEKVAGGYDFAGNNYNAEPEDVDFQPVPQPDPDPMDCYTHGTHVAGIAAGKGVQQDQTTYAGPYNAATSAIKFRVAPGVAPLAQIYALKVFGCTGSSEITDLAIEWAVDPNQDGDLSDHVDVINMSLGSTYGSIYDPSSVAANNAIAAGVIVVASAGNSSNNYYVTGSPAVADGVISVAAGRQGASLNGLYAAMASFSSRGPRPFDSMLKPDMTAPGFDIFSAAQGTGADGSNKSGTSMAAPHVAGAMALLRQLYPTASVLELKARVMNTAMPFIRNDTPITATLYSPMRIGAGLLDLPNALRATALAYNAEKPMLVSLSFGTPAVLTTTLLQKNIQVQNQLAQAMEYQVTYAPVTHMPGVTITLPVTAFSVPASGFVDFPVVLTADVANMRHSRDATLNNTNPFARHWLSEEAGYLLLWPQPTASYTLLTPAPASTTSGAVSFAFDVQHKVLSYTVQITSNTPLTLTSVALHFDQRATSSNMITALAANVPISPAGGILSGTLTLAPVAEQLLRDNRLWLHIASTAYPTGELSSQITLPQPVLKVPLYAAPYPVAAMRAVTNTFDFGITLSATRAISLAGVGLQTGSALPTNTVGLVSVAELQLSSPNAPPLEAFPGEIDLYDHADLQYVGVTSDYVAQAQTVNDPLAQTTIYFALSTYAEWSSPNEVEFAIYVDTNEDGVNDYRLFNSDQLGYNSDSLVSDAYISAIEDLHTGQLSTLEPLNGTSPALLDTALLHSNVMLLPVRATALGLIDSPGFNYYIESFSIDRKFAEDGHKRPIERTPIRRFDPTHPGIVFTSIQPGAPTLHDLPGTRLPFTFDLVGMAQNSGQGILLLHHHNRPGTRAEAITIHYQWPHRLFLPLVAK